MTIRDFYEEFKLTEEYKVMTEYDKGVKVDNTLKEVKRFVDSKEN
jgi:hypothetical protein